MTITHHLINALSRRGDLSPRGHQLLADLRPEIVSFQPGDVIVKAQTELDHSCVIVSGMVARAHHIEGRPGKRVISALHVAGDFVDLHGFVLKRLQHDIISMGPSTIQFVQHVDLEKITEECPDLTRLIWLTSVIDASIHRQWLVAAASLRTTPHLAHLLCELYVRMEIAGICDNFESSLPLLQRDLATILGYSSIHINRAVRDLRERGLIDGPLSKIKILDWPGLKKLAHFDPEYLELEKRPR